jgi:hypothetical protein
MVIHRRRKLRFDRPPRPTIDRDRCARYIQKCWMVAGITLAVGVLAENRQIVGGALGIMIGAAAPIAWLEKLT